MTRLSSSARRFEWAPQANYRALGHVDLAEVSGIVLGLISSESFASTPFQQRWLCFSLVPKKGATPRPCIEIQASDSMQLRIWFMGLQSLIQQPPRMKRSLARLLWYTALWRFRVWRASLGAGPRRFY
eukprot:tig00020556_g11021.t1